MIVFGQVCFVCCLALRISCYQDFPDGYHYQKAFPEDIMVDVINNFGLALLEAHNEGNDDNIALSPYGATSVLVALKEGLRGYAGREIETSMHLPPDLSVIRIGLRDVHRHLKSYFIPKEGFLAGLTLSNDKVDLLSNYESILRFYGYDLESFNNPLYPDAFEGAAPPNRANTTSIFETTNEQPTTPLPSTNPILMSTTLDAMVKEETVISTTEATPTTEKEDQSKQKEDPTESETTEFVTPARADETTESVTGTRATTIKNQVTKNAPSGLTSSTTERTPKEGTRITTTEESSSEKENMETMSSITEGFTVRSTLPMKTSTLTTFLTDGGTTSAPSTLSINTESTLNTVSTTQTKTEGTSTTEMELTTSLEENVNPNKNGSDAATTENHLDSTVFNGVSTTQEKSEDTSNTATMTTPKEMELTASLEENINSNKNGSDAATTENGVVSTSSDSMDTVSTTQTNSEGTSNIVSTTTTMEPTTSFEENQNSSNNSGLNQNGGDSATAESHVLPVDSTGVFQKEKDEESTTDVTVTSITTSVTTITSKFGKSNESLGNETTEEPLTTEDYTLEDYSSYEDGTESSSSTDNEVLEDSSGDDYDYSTENVTEEFEANKTRKSRSIVDYLIAKYHDSFHAGNRKGRHYDYEPEESMSFLVYGRIREPNINFMNYDAVLPFAYLPGLDALALSFPLDSSEYYLLLVLPVEANGIDGLIYDLKRTLSLREIIGSLNFTRVKAVIPSFMLKGYVILTSTLQKLGVRKIFEPRHADFSLMTEEPNLYVTNVEQAVTVTIRNYIDPEKLPRHRNLQEFRTVEFKADHPFLYFVMDSRIHVTLMAGKIVNPLNSRIR